MKVTMREAKVQLGKLVQKAISGEEVVIVQNNVEVAKLTSIRQQRKLGTAKGLLSISTDFNEPLDDFKNCC